MFSLHGRGEVVMPEPGIDDALLRVKQFLQENTPFLQGIICSYVVKMGLAHAEGVEAVASEILQDAVFEALAHAERLEAGIQPRAWFLGIAANIIKRKRVEAAKLQQREVWIVDAERDFFDQFAAYAEPGKKLEEDERVNEMLALVSKEDQEVLRLALLHELDMKTVARILHVTPGTARVRLHRAIHRLRIAWKAEGEKHV